MLRRYDNFFLSDQRQNTPLTVLYEFPAVKWGQG